MKSATRSRRRAGWILILLGAVLVVGSGVLWSNAGEQHRRAEVGYQVDLETFHQCMSKANDQPWAVFVCKRPTEPTETPYAVWLTSMVVGSFSVLGGGGLVGSGRRRHPR